MARPAQFAFGLQGFAPKVVADGSEYATVTCNMPDMDEQAKPSVRERVATHRARLRRQGLRPVQIWVPDVRAPGFAAEAHRQSALAAASPHEAEDQAFVDAISWFADEGDE